jgi:hypothetical protein
VAGHIESSRVSKISHLHAVIISNNLVLTPST